MIKDGEQILKTSADEKLLKTTDRIMTLFVLLPDADPVPRSAAVRTFLSSYLILGHPTHVFSRDGDQEQDLITKAKDLVISFESALAKLTKLNAYTPSPTRTETVLLANLEKSRTSLMLRFESPHHMKIKNVLFNVLIEIVSC